VEIGGGRKEEKSLKTTNNQQVLKIKKLSWSAKEMVLSTLFELSTTYLDQHIRMWPTKRAYSFASTANKQRSTIDSCQNATGTKQATP
jgi:hypothetical protein